MDDHRADQEEGLIPRREVCRLTGLSKSTIYRLKNQGRFPQKVYSSDRRSLWHRWEVVAWIKALDGRPPGKWERPE